MTAASQSSTITDPQGDAYFNFNIGTPLAAPGYEDIVLASVSAKDGRFLFSLEMAADVPQSPILPSGVKMIEWSWRIDTNPDTFPTGYFWPPQVTAPAEYMVFVLWDGSTFISFVIDRTASLTGGEPQVYPVSLRIKGAGIVTSVDATLLGNPSEFLWFSVVQLWSADLGTEGFVGIDVALAPGGVWASWPA